MQRVRGKLTGRVGLRAQPICSQWLVGLTLAMTLGCGKSTAPASSEATACDSDAQCLNGYHCAKGVCEKDCGSDGDCRNGFRCSAGVCSEEAPCDTNAQCLNGFTCLGGQCTAVASGSGGANATSPFGSTTGGIMQSIGTGLAYQGGNGGAPTLSNVQGGAAPDQTRGTQAGAANVTQQVGSVTPISSAQLQQLAGGACNGQIVEPPHAHAKLAIVLDLSSSMNSAVAGMATKYEVVRDALLAVFADTASLDANTSVGMLLYPNLRNDEVFTTPTDASTCIHIEAAVASKPLGPANSPARAALASAFTDAILGRGTPTADAYAWSLENLLLTDEQRALPGRPHVLLITDGSPTLYAGCYNPAGILSNLTGDHMVELVAKAATSDGVRSHFIAIPGAESAQSWLSKAAVAGGTAAAGCDVSGSASANFCHQDLTAVPDQRAGLRAALAAVLWELSGCRYLVPDSVLAAADPSFNPILTYGSSGRIEVLHRHTSAVEQCAEGYRVINGRELELCEQTCERSRLDGPTTLDLVVGCEAEFGTTVP